MWPLSERAARAALVFLQMLVAARALGPNEFGRLILAMTIVAVLTPVARLGLENILIKDIARTPSLAYRLMCAALGMRLLASLLVIAIALISAAWVSHSVELPGIVLLIALGVGLQSFDVIDQYFKAVVKAKRSSVVGLVQCHTTFALIALIALFHGPLWLYGVALFLDGAIAAIGYSIALRADTGSLPRPHFRTNLSLDLLKQSYPILAAGLLALCYMRIDHFVIQALLGSEALGQYAVVVKISDGVNFIPVVICSLLLPPLTNAQGLSTDLYERRFIWLCRLLLVLSVGFAVAFTAFGESVVTALYGEAYAGAGKVLAILSWCSPLIAIGVASSMYFVVEKATVLTIHRTGAGAAVSIVLNLLLVPDSGLLGAALAAVLSYAVATLAVFHHPTGRRYLMLLAAAIGLRPTPKIKESSQ